MKIVKASKGICDSTAQPGDMLQVHYTGRFDDENGKIFDSSHNHGQLYKFQLGAGQVSTFFFHFFKQNNPRYGKYIHYSKTVLIFFRGISSS